MSNTSVQWGSQNNNDRLERPLLLESGLEGARAGPSGPSPDGARKKFRQSKVPFWALIMFQQFFFLSAGVVALYLGLLKKSMPSGDGLTALFIMTAGVVVHTCLTAGISYYAVSRRAAYLIAFSEQDPQEITRTDSLLYRLRRPPRFLAVKEMDRIQSFFLELFFQFAIDEQASAAARNDTNTSDMYGRHADQRIISGQRITSAGYRVMPPAAAGASVVPAAGSRGMGKLGSSQNSTPNGTLNPIIDNHIHHHVTKSVGRRASSDALSPTSSTNRGGLTETTVSASTPLRTHSTKEGVEDVAANGMVSAASRNSSFSQGYALNHDENESPKVGQVSAADELLSQQPSALATMLFVHGNRSETQTMGEASFESMETPTASVDNFARAMRDAQDASDENDSSIDPLNDNACSWEVAMTSVPDPGGSLFFSLLKQIKVGESLARIRLPVHVLESRSMLEKLSDTFIHSELLSLIPRGPTADPAEQLLAVVRWFFSSFHIRPNGAKKPYNPAIGEMFACVYDLPACGDAAAIAEDAKTGGPAPLDAYGEYPAKAAGGQPNRVVLLAEQVSKHPPVSALAAKGPGWSYRAVYHPKSRLLSPNSAGTTGEGVGGAILTFDAPVDGETKAPGPYYIGWPSIFVKGFLTGSSVIELGETVIIKDLSTVAPGLRQENSSSSKKSGGGPYGPNGLYTKVKFNMKGWISSEVDTFTATFYNNEKKLDGYNLSGTWHGQIFRSEIDPRSPHLDANNTSNKGNKVTFIKKPFMHAGSRLPMPRPQAFQLKGVPAEQHSRKMWEGLTDALRKRQLDQANVSKDTVENHQRVIRKQLEDAQDHHRQTFFRFCGTPKMDQPEAERATMASNENDTAVAASGTAGTLSHGTAEDAKRLWSSPDAWRPTVEAEDLVRSKYQPQ